MIQQESIELCNFPEMPKLKKLVIEFGQTSDESLIALTSLIRASPYLQEFVLAVCLPLTPIVLVNDFKFIVTNTWKVLGWID